MQQTEIQVLPFRLYSSAKKIMLIVYALSAILSVSCHKKSLPADDDKFNKHIDSICTYLYQSNQKEKAFRMIDSAFNIPENQSITGMHIKYSWKILECKNKNNNKAIGCELQYLDSIFYLLEHYHKEADYPEFYCSVHFSKGDYYMNLGDYDKTFEYYTKGLRIAETIASPCLFASLHYRMAKFYYQQGKPDEAKNYFERNLQESITCGDSWVMFANRQEVVSNIAECFIKLKQPDSSIFYSNKNISFLSGYQQKHSADEVLSVNYILSAKGVAYDNLANAFRLQHKLDSAKKYYEISFNINRRPGFDNKHAQSVLLSLAQLYLEKGELTKASQKLNAVKQSLDSLPNDEVLVDYKNAVYKYFKENNNLKKSNKYLQEYYLLRDSINERKKNFLNSSMEQKLNEFDRRYQIELLEKENELERNSVRFTAIALFLLGTLIIIGSIAWFRKIKVTKKLAGLYEELNLQKSELEKSGKEKDRILRVVVHDLRNPLGAIATASENILENESLAEEDAKRIELIKHASVNSLKLIDELLETNREKTDQALEKEKINLQNLIKECAAIFEIRLNQKQIKLQFNLPDQPIIANVNAGKIARLIGNLLSNAIKFSNDSSLVLIKLTSNENKIILSVEDQGIGIPANELSNIFSMFTTSKRAGTSGEKSFGIGLSICKEIAEAHGGKIWVENEEGKGCKFFVELPVIN